jgi:putative ABC transport system permease protein
MIAVVGRLATQDFVFDRRLFFCFVMALAAVLAPLEVLLGLKYGVVEAFREQLLENPRIREITNGSNRAFDAAFFDRLRARPDVAFVLPRTRSLAATINLQREGGNNVVVADIVPTATDDPLLEGKVIPIDSGAVVLSTSAAEKLGVHQGDRIVGTASRIFEDRREAIRLQLQVLDVTSAFPRDGAFASIDLLTALEDYRDGHAVPAFRWPGAEASGPRLFAGFRLYARRLEDVFAISAALRQADVDVRDHGDEIGFVLALDRNLSVMFGVIAAIGSVGYVLSLGASLWANVERKRKQLSVLRLLGLSGYAMVAFPVLQAGFVAVAGVTIANSIFIGVARIINSYFSSQLIGSQAICRLTLAHMSAMAAITLAAALISAALAGWRSAHVQPSEGLREL